MISAEMLKAAEQRRLAWRCRRGMLELDIVLQRFVKTKFQDLTIDEFKVFDELLSLPDNEFWTLIKTEKTHKNAHLEHIIAMLNETSNALALKDL